MVLDSPAARPEGTNLVAGSIWMGGRTMVRPPAVTGTTDPNFIMVTVRKFHLRPFGPCPWALHSDSCIRRTRVWPVCSSLRGGLQQTLPTFTPWGLPSANFGIFGEAGVAYQAVENFYQIAPNAQGKLIWPSCQSRNLRLRECDRSHRHLVLTLSYWDSTVSRGFGSRRDSPGRPVPRLDLHQAGALRGDRIVSVSSSVDTQRCPSP